LAGYLMPLGGPARGIALSMGWKFRDLGATTLHVLGYIDRPRPGFCTGLRYCEGRLRRAEAIGKRLEGEGIPLLQGALGFAATKQGRAHFALLVAVVS
jgi:hypothetical protein